LLGQEQDAEDAFQATFLVLAQKATRILEQGSVKSWLYGVATRIALTMRRSAQRRRARELAVPQRPSEGPAHTAALGELQAILAEEVDRLPPNYRSAFALCCLEGQSKAEAAKELGWPEGTVSSRLARAKERLRRSLARRGIELGSPCASPV